MILSKPLDYEAKAVLTVTIHASVRSAHHMNSPSFGSKSDFFDPSFVVFFHCQEMNTAEHFNTSTNLTITVLDGDDQYPQFLPCVLLFQDASSRVCTSPVYTVNVTEGEEVSSWMSLSYTNYS